MSSISGSTPPQDPSNQASSLFSLELKEILDPLLLDVVQDLNSQRDIILANLPTDSKIRKYLIEANQFLNKVTENYYKIIGDRTEEGDLAVKNSHNNLKEYLLNKPLFKDLKNYINLPALYEPNFQKLLLYQQQVVNQIYNRISYRSEILNNLKANRKLLEAEFSVPQNAKLGIKWLKGEGHNQGRKAVIIGYEKDGEMQQLVYKPRDSRIDKEILETFRQINDLHKNSTSQSQLPQYKIVNLNDNKSSVWEFIEGEHPKAKIRIGRAKKVVITSAHNFVSNKKCISELASSLAYMNKILHSIYVSDLHGENIIFQKNSDGLYCAIVPIDLENVYICDPNGPLELNPAPSTGLGGHLTSTLSAQEKEITDQFKRKAHQFQVRYIPIGTFKLSGFITGLDTQQTFLNLLREILSGDKIRPEMNYEVVRKAYVRDVLNRDVPFLSEHNGSIYYGPVSQGLKIGERLWQA